VTTPAPSVLHSHSPAYGVRDALPTSAQPAANKALSEIWGAEAKDRAHVAIRAFDKAYGAKFPKAVKKITDDEDVVLAFYDYPSEHWIHLRTTSPSPRSRPCGCARR
jgi:transposase-like protein